MIQLSLFLLLLTLQTTIQAADHKELPISTYEEWLAEEAARASQQAVLEMQKALAAKRRREKLEKQAQKNATLLGLQEAAQTRYLS